MRVVLTLIGNILRTAFAPLWILRRALARPKARWVEVKLAPHIEEVVSAVPLWRRVLQARTQHEPRLRSVDGLWRLARMVAHDTRVDGIVLHVPHLHSGWATCSSARAPLLWLRERGKQVVVFLPLGGAQRELYLASAADRIYTPPQATIALLGVAAQTTYLKPLLDRIGVAAEVFACGEFKTAAEPLVRETMSDAQRLQLGALVESLQRELEAALAARPALDAARAKALFERGMYRASAAQRAGLIDGCCYEDALPAMLVSEAASTVAASESGKGRPAKVVIEHPRYFAYQTDRLWRPVSKLPAIGIVPVHGAISHAEPRLPQSRGASLGAVVAALRAARADDNVRAVILHVDSPGGSALASDLIHRELVRLREKKPVIACFGNVAASGGYYVAAACQRIVAQPTTTTGSIGVIAAKVLAAELAQHVGVRPQSVQATPHADMFSPFHALSDDERAMMRREVDEFYTAFLDVVAVGRSRTVEEIDKLARGRVWAGDDAAQAGLVDVLGGLERAIDEIIALTPALRGLSRDELALKVVSAPHGTPPIEPPAAPSAVELHAHHELAALLGSGEGALYYAMVPKLGG